MPRILRKTWIPFSILLLFVIAAKSVRSEPDASVKTLARILQMEDERESTPELLGLLKDPSAEIRSRAALAVGRIGRPSDIASLALLLQDRDPEARRNTAFALGEIEDSTAADPLAALLVGGSEKDATVRALAVEGLGKLRRHPEACLAALRDGEIEVQAAALLAAWKIPLTGHIEEIVQMAPHKNVEIRWTAAYCLMRFLGAPAAGRTPIPGGIHLTRSYIDLIGSQLLELASDDSPRVRLPAVRGLRTIGAPEVTTLLLERLADPDWRVRVEAIRALATVVPDSLGGPRTVSLEPIALAIQDENSNVGVTALEALARVGDDSEAVAVLEKHLAHPIPRFREVAFESWVARARASIPPPAEDSETNNAGDNASGATGGTGAEDTAAPEPPRLDEQRTARLIEIVDRLLQDHHWSVRAVVAGSLDLLPDEKRLSVTRALVEDDKRVAKFAYSALFAQLTDGEPDSSTPRLLARIEPSLRPLPDGEPDSSAPGLLARIEPDLSRAMQDDDPIIRIAALDAVREMYETRSAQFAPASKEWYTEMMALAELLRQTYAANAERPELAEVRQTVIDIAGNYLQPAEPDDGRGVARPSDDSAPWFERLFEIVVGAGLQDPSYLVRRTAVTELREAGKTARAPAEAGGQNEGMATAEPVGTGRSLQDYIELLEWAKTDHKVVIDTNRGPLEARLLTQEAPLTCWNFTQLANAGFYDDGRWHRVVPDFVLQDGCPRGDGWGGPPHSIRCEINRARYLRGALGMALSGKDTGGSQFFFTHSDQPHLDGGYTVFGTLLRGHEIMDQIAQGEPIESIRVVEE